MGKMEISKMKNNIKKSKYLENKCENLSNTLNYFSSGGYNFSENSKHLIFLSQIDFWDFEIDSLIFSFDNFKERSKAWNSEKNIEKMLIEKDITVKPSILKNIKFDYGYNWKEETEAPYEDLERLIKKWNLLIGSCEKLISNDLEKYNMTGLRDLNKYKKE